MRAGHPSTIFSARSAPAGRVPDCSGLRAVFAGLCVVAGLVVGGLNFLLVRRLLLRPVDEVTEQTGLLALFAAIIATQAGEHGREFAVVADEIKNLANRTADSTLEIAGIVRAIREQADAA